MFQKLMGEGALSVREKELIALAIGMALRCESCIYAHAEKAVPALKNQMEREWMAITFQTG